MPHSRVTPKRLPVHPGKDSRFTIKHNATQGNAWWVYYEPEGSDPVPADHAHTDLVECVNRLKEAEGSQPGGSFSINEHGQVVARTNAPPGYDQLALHLVDVSGGSVFTYPRTITFNGGLLDPSATPVSGMLWPGPLCGISYTFAAPEARRPPSNKLDEIRIELDGIPVQLSKHLAVVPYPPASGPLAVFLSALRRCLPGGGRFRVNEMGRAFTANTHLFVGTVPAQPDWFRPIALTD